MDSVNETVPGFSNQQQQQQQQQQFDQSTEGMGTLPRPSLQPPQDTELQQQQQQQQQSGDALPQIDGRGGSVGLAPPALDTSDVALDPMPGGDLPLDLPMLTPRTLKASGLEDVQWGDFLALDDMGDLEGVLEGMPMEEGAGAGGQGGGITSVGGLAGLGAGVDNINKQGSTVSC